MALITCPECEGMVSDRAKACPHCGFVLESSRCPECGAKVTADAQTCTACGFPLKQAQPQAAPTPAAAPEYITVTSQVDLLRTYGFYSFVNAETGVVLVRRLMGKTVNIPAKKPFMLRARATGTSNKSTTCYVIPGRRYVLRWTDGFFGSLVLEEE